MILIYKNRDHVIHKLSNNNIYFIIIIIRVAFYESHDLSSCVKIAVS